MAASPGHLFGVQPWDPVAFTAMPALVIGLDFTRRPDVTGPTDYMRRPPYKAHPAKMPLLLQDHDQPVHFRNICIRELSE